MYYLDPERDNYLNEVRRRREISLQRMRQIPIAVLIWGATPTATSPIGMTRCSLRDQLRANGYIANFSEDFYEPDSEFSIQAQQVADIEAHDLVLSLPSSPGSIAEIHDFFRVPGCSNKIVTYLNQAWNNGYSNKSLIELKSTATADIILYEEELLPDCILNSAFDLVRRLQETYYLLGRRTYV